MPLGSALKHLSPKSRDLLSPAREMVDRAYDTNACPDHFHKGQLEAWQSKALEVVVAAGTQGGKTEEERFWLLRELRRSAPFIKKLGFGRAIYAGPTMTLMEQQVIPQFKALFEDELSLGKYIGGSKPTFRFSEEGSRWLLGFSSPLTVHFAYMTSANNVESMTACCGVWDEAGQSDNKKDAYQAFNRRLKAARSWTFGEAYAWLEQHGFLAEFAWWVSEFYDVEGPEARFGRRFWGTTPYEWNWFKDDIYDRAEKGHKDFSLHNFDSWMNPLVSEEACNEELALGMEQWKWDMMYRGRFTRPAGAIYEDFNDQHLIEPFLIPHGWDHVMGIDFGPVHTAAIFGAMPPDRSKVVIYGTYCGDKVHQEDMTKEEKRDIEKLRAGHAAKILTKARKAEWHERDEHGKLRFYEGDFTCWGGAPSEEEWRTQFRMLGIPVSRPGLKELEAGITSVRAALLPASPKLFIFKNLLPLAKEFREYSRVLGPDGLPTDKILNKEKYHRLDGVRYLIAGLWPYVVQSVTKETKYARSNDD